MMNIKKERRTVILLVEDDPDDILLTKDALTESDILTDLEVVGDGEALLDYLRGRKDYKDQSCPRPDLILLDLNMPRMDGREVLKELKSDPELSSIPVIVLTTSQQPEDITQIYRLGGNSFITKPVKFDELVKIMRNLGKYWFETVKLPTSRS